MANNHSMTEHTCRKVAEFLSVFSNTTRMQILCCLKEGSRTVSEIAKYAGVSLPNISQHLRIMRDKGALQTEKQGQQVYYQIANRQFLKGIMLIREALEKQLNKAADSIAEI